MMEDIDNLDRQLLGYLNEYPNAMYSQISCDLCCSKVLIQSRLQRLINNQYLKTTSEYKFALTEKAAGKFCLPIHIPETFSDTAEFDWGTLFIPMTLE